MTTKQRKRIVTLYRRGSTLHEVAASVGFSYAHVRRALIACGVPRRKSGSKLCGPASPSWGRKHTKAARAKMSAAHLGKGAGRHLDGYGYMKILMPEHPLADVSGYVFEHRAIMERKLGRYLLRSELVHHKNGVRVDNRLRNLQVMTRSQHSRLHALSKQPSPVS